MVDLTRREAFGIAAGSAAATWVAAPAAARPDMASSTAALAAPADHRLWYRVPADLERRALVVGNGRLGAMIRGGVRDEAIPLNEDSLWCGQPHDWHAPDARDTLTRIRAAVFAGDHARADALAKTMQGPFSHSYAPLATLRLAFEHDGAIDGYTRELDLDAAVATVAYRAGGVQHRREIFASHPAQLILLRFHADRPGALDCRIALDAAIRHRTRTDHRGITLSGKAPTYCAPNYKKVADPIVYSDEPGRGMAFATRLELLSLVDGGCEVDGDALVIRGATEVVIGISAATGFRGFDRAPDTPATTVLEQALQPIAAARGVPFDRLRTQHSDDHRSLYRRLSLRLASATSSGLPTDERLAANARTPDPSLAALYSNFSRYLLIASSRAGTQAANLQGIWNWELRPPWSCNYTTNINVQQNYWGAEACNLAELHGPLLDYVEQVARTGTRTARELYGLEGWCVHHNSDLWRLSSPVGEGAGNPTWANFALAGPWLVRHMWDHYLYSGDRRFLANRAYPLLKGCALFCAGWLVQDPHSDRLTTAPSVSTENTFVGPDGKVHSVTAGCTMDVAMIREVFGFAIEAATILGVDSDFVRRLRSMAVRLPPFRIGRHGQLQEWDKDFVEAEPDQRHISHLYAVAPGWQITPRATPELARAAHVSMVRRLQANGAQTGWSRAWAIHVFARLGDGERAYQNLNALLSSSTGPTLLDVLPSADGPLFQIDGNFAGGAAVIEMILQSHGGVIAFLPALPAAWAEGELRGVRARGGVMLDMAWSEGRMQTAVMTATANGRHHLVAPPGQAIATVAGGRRIGGGDGRSAPAEVALAAGAPCTVTFQS